MITFVVTVTELGEPTGEEPGAARARLRRSFVDAIVRATNELQQGNPAIRIVDGVMIPAIVQETLQSCTGARQVVVVDSRSATT